jgi:hypothetical protein
MTTTRLNNYDRERTVQTLEGILSNIPRFVQIPISDKAKWTDAWNSKFPRELFDAMDTLTRMGYGVTGADTEHFRVVVEREGRMLTTLIRLEMMPGEYKRKPVRLSPDMAINNDIARMVRFNGNKKSVAMVLQLDYMQQKFGAEDTAAFLDWIYQTAELRDELNNARQVIKDVFGMVRTAGQIKRMVPDLLQYLPDSLRQAYDEQKRASSLPFEWAPYPKGNVERMILTISKGHLLANMAKPGQEQWNIDSLEGLMWGSYADVAVA